MVKKSGCRSVAIVELTGVHEEIIPSLVDALPEGVHAEVFVNSRCRDLRGDIFAEIAGLDASVTYVEIVSASDWLALGARIDSDGHEALIISTFQIEGVALWGRARRTPVIGVVHNPILFQQSEACKSFLAENELGVIVLAPHVAARLNGMTGGAFMDRLAVVEPVFWGDRKAVAPASRAERRQVIVPGGVNFTARDFKGLIDVLSPDRVQNMRGVGVQLLVIGGGPDRATLEQMLAERRLDNVIDLLPLSASGRVPYDAYVAALTTAWAIYPLLPLGWPPYRDYKITSAIPTAVGFALPVVLDRWTDSAYRVPALVTDASIAASLDEIVALDGPRRTALVEAVRAYGSAARQRNRLGMRRLFEQAAAKAVRAA